MEVLPAATPSANPCFREVVPCLPPTETSSWTPITVLQGDAVVFPVVPPLSPGPPRSWEEAVALLTRQEGEQSKASGSPPAHLPSSRLCPPPPQHSVAPIPPGEEWPLAWVVRGTCKGLAGLQSQSQRGQTQDLLPPTSGAPAALLAVLGVGPLGTWDSKEEPQRVPRAPIRMSTQEPPGGRPEAGTKGEVTCQLVQVCWLGPQGSHRLGGRGR